MEDRERFLTQILLSKGITKTMEGINIPAINKYLNLIDYDVVEFPHRGVLVLKDRLSSTAVEHPWKPKEIDDAKRVLEGVATQRYFDEASETAETLIERNYLRREEGLKFTERALVQFSEYIEGLNGRFKKCRLCGFLGDEGEFHRACENEMKRKTRA